MFNESTAPVAPVSLAYRGGGPFRRRPRNTSSWFPSGTAALRLSLLIVLALGSVGCGGGGVWVYVDNGGDEPMVVTVDGHEEATVAPGQCEKIVCQPGERQLQIRCGANVLFEGAKNLPESDSIGVSRRYLFNPDNRNRYRTYVVKYGSSPFEGLFKAREDSLSGTPQSQIHSVYKKLAAEPQLLPPDAWFEVPRGAYVLQDAPQVVVTRGYTERRTVLARVDPKDYAFIAAARENKNPSEDDLDDLAEVVERVLDATP
jgi:hypothetical protein